MTSVRFRPTDGGDRGLILLDAAIALLVVCIAISVSAHLLSEFQNAQLRLANSLAVELEQRLMLLHALGIESEPWNW